MEVKLAKVRLAFPQLFHAKSFGDGDPAYSAAFILEDEHIAIVEKAIVAVAKEKWGEKYEPTLKAIRAKGDTCLRNGDEKSNYDGFEGRMYISSRSKTRPTVVDRDRTPLTEADGKPYAGCYVNVILDVWAQANEYGKRVNASLKGVQFHSDGEAFGGGGAARADDFDVIEEEFA